VEKLEAMSMPENQATPAEKLKFSRPDAAAPSEEAQLWEGGYSAKAMYGMWLLGLVLTAAGILVVALTALSTNRTAWLALAGGVAALWLLLIGVYFYRKLSRWYVLTTQRLKHRDGILFRKLNRVELIDIDDVSYNQGPIQTLLGVGNLIVKSSDVSHPMLVLTGIADVRRVSELVDNARREERRRRSVHIESV